MAIFKMAELEYNTAGGVRDFAFVKRIIPHTCIRTSALYAG